MKALYTAEIWTLKEHHKKKLEVFEMSVLRRILRDRRRNLDIKKKLGINLSIVQIIQQRRLSYFGHVVRMNEERYPNMLL